MKNITNIAEYMEIIRIINCMSLAEFMRGTGFKNDGGYAQAKFSKLQNDFSLGFCELDLNRANAVITFAQDKMMRADYS